MDGMVPSIKHKELDMKGKQIITLFTGKKFITDENGFLVIYVAHVRRGNSYEVKEFDSISDLRWFSRHLERHNYSSDIHCSCERHTTINGGRSFSSFRYNSLSF